MKLAIIHGKIVTMSDKEKEVIPGGTLLVKDGIIERILENKEEIPAEYRKIDAKGCFVMPGFIEAHCHMGITEEKKGMEGDDCNEGVDPITPSLRAIDAINPMDDAFHNAVKAGITAANIGPGSSNVVGGQFVVVNNHGRCIDEMVLKAPSALKVAFGENPKVNYSGMSKSPATRMAIAAMLRKELLCAKHETFRLLDLPDDPFSVWDIVEGEGAIFRRSRYKDCILFRKLCNGRCKQANLGAA